MDKISSQPGIQLVTQQSASQGTIQSVSWSVMSVSADQQASQPVTQYLRIIRIS
jgi:hypothetical protein